MALDWWRETRPTPEAVGPAEHLQVRLRAETRRCLPVDVRRDSLGESDEDARRHFDACTACVPGFFERLEGVPRGAVEPYVEAWRAYRTCLDREAGGVGW